MTPTEPAITASAPEPRLTSAMSRTISFQYAGIARGTQARARPKNDSCSPRSSRTPSGQSMAGFSARSGRGNVPVAAMSDRLLRHDLEVDRRDHEVHDEQQHERDDHGLVDRVADALGAALRVESLVRRAQCGERAEDQCFQLADVQVGQLGERGERRDVGTRGAVLQQDVEGVTTDDADDGY